MRYTKRVFAADLLKQLDEGFDVVRLARWAMRLYSDRIRDFDAGVDDVIMNIVVMEEGPEFEMSEQELRDFAARLITESPPETAA